MLRPFLAALCALFALPAAASAAFAPFATINGNCNGYGTFYGPIVPAAHGDTVVRYTVSAGRGRFDASDVAAGEVVWDVGSSIAANTAPEQTASSCAPGTAFATDFFDRPTAPATFSGTGNADSSALGFLAPGTAPYVADLQLNGGGVKLQYSASGWFSDTREQSMASSGSFPLGTVKKGQSSLFVTALSGPRPYWTVTIRPLPVSFSEVGFGQPISRPGAFLPASYSTDGDTTVDAVVRNAAGQPVRTLASALAVEAGKHSLPWDGLDGAGHALPDGVYWLTLSGRDAAGFTNSALASVALDGAPPDVAITSPATIGPQDAILGTVTDAIAGLQEATVSEAPDDSGGAVQKGATTFTLKPDHGRWTLGRHRITVTAKDTVGNARTFVHDFTVAQAAAASPTTASGAPKCSRSAAEAMTGSDAAALQAIRRTGNSGYGVARVICADLDGDKDTDMAVLMRCCTVSSVAVVLVFRNTGKAWSLAFSSVKKTVFAMSRKGRAIVLKTPHYKRTDGNCCPSSYRYYTVKASKGKFRLRPGRR